MKPALIFSLTAVPDVDGLRRLHSLPAELSAHEVAEFAYQRRRAADVGDCLPPHQQRIVHISMILREGGLLRLISLSGEESNILQSFYDLASNVGQILEWSGVTGQEALPAATILRCRAMQRHLPAIPGGVPVIDLAALLASPLSPETLPLYEMATLSQLPFPKEKSQEDVWQAFLSEGVEGVEVSNEIRALTVYQLWLRYRCMCGELDAAASLQELALLRQTLRDCAAPHLHAYLAAWSACAD
ncbi:hypothetical protein Q9Q94_12220 [Uliginosibacterium sp. 31-16]|uniref:hypothetical protein n=1 Tax=Uliginosibacterium sp. 31-16 TaxID=3068315 RepID=UPI00273E8898|nr:hypothetical protein [Uliginosibacterium sp. 31-16]MDP5240299.1 hypothetical protein [Uliginosibacterium sp. 31-16]